MYTIFQYDDPISGATTDVQLADCPSFPFNIKKKFEHINSTTQDGYIFTRPRFTKDRSTIQLNWDYLLDTDKNTLDDFETAIRSVVSFKYFNEWPSTPDTNFRTVVLQNAISYELVMRTEASKYWNVAINIEDV